MIQAIQIIVLLLAVLAAVAMLARRLQLPPAILLVLVGVALALVPGLPRVELAPEVVLLLVLPPLIYSAGVSMSWREFRFNLRPIALLAIGCVLFTTAAVAALTHGLLGLPWGVAFVLGAIVSPPDVVAPLAIVRRLQLPRRLAVVLEGEGLANDATALILYRFAVVAVSAGTFSMTQATGTFAAILVGEVAWGMFVGWAMLHVRHFARDPRVEITLALLTPYAAYWLPEHFGGSGVLATVAAGLYVSWNGPRLIGAATRLQGVFFWDLLIYLIEGVVFLLTGLQARTLIDRIGSTPLGELLLAAAVTSAVVILARFVWVFPATYLPRLVLPGLARRDPAPNWRLPFVLAFTGVRGIVSLAAALAIPLTTANGAPFPYRDLILFLTFCVILVTVVGLGLALPWVVRRLGLVDLGIAEHAEEEQEENAARRRAVAASAKRLDALAAEGAIPPPVSEALRARHADRARTLECGTQAEEEGRRYARLRRKLELALIAAERKEINAMLRAGELKDEARRRIERELDLAEAHLRGDTPNAINHD